MSCHVISAHPPPPRLSNGPFLKEALFIFIFLFRSIYNNLLRVIWLAKANLLQSPQVKDTLQIDLVVQGQMHHIPKNLASNINLSYCRNLWSLESKLHKNSCSKDIFPMTLKVISRSFKLKSLKFRFFLDFHAVIASKVH